MKAKAESISLTMTRKEGEELRSQILKLTNDGGMKLYSDLRGTPLADLFELLSGNFESSTKGVNFTD